MLCSIEDVRAYVDPQSISDIDITNIISRVTTEILTKAKATDESNAYLIQAGIHGAVSATMKKARSNGELAAGVETPESRIQNTGLIEEIKGHEEERDNYIKMYKMSSFSIPSGRMGYKTVNNSG